MKKQILSILLVAMALPVMVFGADKLGVAEPISKGALKAEEVDMLWSMLESSIQSEKYTVITRSALQQMMTEIGLTTSSDLLNLNTNQKAKLGMIEGVKYILVSEVGTFGTRINCTMRVIDSSTGEVIPLRTANIRVKDLDELADQLEPTLEKLFSDNKQLRRSALLTPIVKAENAPANFADDLTVNMENCLIQAGLQLQNLKSVTKILADNGIGSLAEVEPKTYSKIGKLLEVELLLQPTITKFELQAFPFVVTETGYQGVNYVGAIDGYLRVISAQTGTVVASIPVDLKVYFQNLDRQITMNWTTADYHKYMLKTAIAQQILPELFKSLQEPAPVQE